MADIVKFHDRVLSHVQCFLENFFKTHGILLKISEYCIRFTKSSKCPGEVIVTCREPLLELFRKCEKSGSHDKCLNDIQKSLSDIIQSNTTRLLQEAFVREEGVIYLKLNRTIIFQEVLREVKMFGNQYGTFSNNKQHFLQECYLIYPVIDTSIFGSTNSSHICSEKSIIHKSTLSCSKESERISDVKSSCFKYLSIENGRTLIIVQLIRNLIWVSGQRNCSVLPCIHEMELKKSSPNFWKILEFMKPTIESSLVKSLCSEKESISHVSISKEMMSKLPVTEQFMTDSHSQFVNGKEFLSKLRLSGWHGYSKNIKLIEACNNDHLLNDIQLSDDHFNAQEVVDLVLKKVKTDDTFSIVGNIAMDIYKYTKDENSRMIIITPQRSVYSSQQAMTVSLMASANLYRNQHQNLKLLETGPVLCYGPKPSLTIEEYFSIRMDQMRESCAVKYGDIFKGSHLEKIVLTMTEAAVKFELLSTDPKNKLKLDLTAEVSRCDGTFVIYNYARLATLLLHYQTAVEKGDYPPLPDIKVIDYSLLKEEEEWDLLYSCVFLYPVIVEEASSLKGEDDNLVVMVQSGLKKLCQFLSKLCHMFSCYYSRVKILLAPETRLIPLIHARMILALAIKQVLFNGLQILGIIPLDQL